MKRFIAALALLFAASAFGQSYPSPTYNNLTVQGTATLTNHPLAVSSGGTNVATASGTALDNITGFASTGFLTRTGAGAYSFQSLTNGVTLGNLAQQAANTVIANATGSTATVTAFSMPSCSTSSSALNWTSGTGFTCNTSINAASLGGTAAANYALLASPTFTGTPAAPTATVGTNTTQLATTAFVIANAGTGRLIGVQVFTSSGTYTPDTGTNSVIVEILAAGGGGGGAAASNGTNIGVSGCGGGGGYIIHRMTSGFSGATVTIGAAGTSGANTGGNGGAGGSTSFGAITAGGGTGGQGTATASVGPANMAPVAGGTATGGNIVNVPGQAGFSGNYGSGSNYAIWQSGGNSIYGAGATQVLNTAGVNATGFGAGGGGIIQTTGGTTARAGGTGSAGLVIVWEYN